MLVIIDEFIISTAHAVKGASKAKQMDLFIGYTYLYNTKLQFFYYFQINQTI